MKVRQIDTGTKILGQNPGTRPDGWDSFRCHRRHLQQRPQRFFRSHYFKKGLSHLELPEKES
jgi:hypothetical protein